jgi:5'(3')-deoxyribonucleotidase
MMDLRGPFVDDRKRIAVDMDNVLADTLSELLARYNREHGASLTKADLHGSSLRSLVSEEHYQHIQDHLRTEEFFEDLPVMPDSQSVLARLAGQYEIYIASSAMEFPNSFGPKYRWLRRHFPFLDPYKFIFCGDKGVLYTHYLIDDSPRNFRNFSGEGILYSAPHNLRTEGYRRVNNWREVAEMFLKDVP